jgi:hypothetical protein
MKIDLYRLSNRLCKVACLTFLIRVAFPTSPSWFVGFAAVAAVAGLVVMLADEIIARKQRELAAKPAVESK